MALRGIQSAPTSSFNFENGGVLTKKHSPYLYKDFDIKEIGGKSLHSILSAADMFRRSDKKHASFANEGAKKYIGGDTPVDFYFKLFFYFDQTDGEIDGARLLGTDVDLTTLQDETYGDKTLWGSLPTAFKAVKEGKKTESNELSNSALNFLLLNCEYERAEKLLKLIELLSYVSTYEPWQFQQLSGVDEALNRKYFTEGDFKIDEQRKSITIKCLPSGYNQNIATIMDLYRDVCFSFIHKKEIVPANLRKFNMGLYIFSTPIRTKNRINYNGNLKWQTYDIPETNYEDENHRNGQGTNLLYCNAKYIEFRNCEFDYNCNIKTYADLNNADGTEMQNELKIFFDDASELRYDANMMRVIGDRCFQDYDYECKPNFWQTDDMRTKAEEAGATDGLTMTAQVDENILNHSISSMLNLSQYASNPVTAAMVAYAQTGVDAAESAVRTSVSNVLNARWNGISVNNALGRLQNMNWNSDSIGQVVRGVQKSREDNSTTDLGKLSALPQDRSETKIRTGSANANVVTFEDRITLGNLSSGSITERIEKSVEELGRLYSKDEMVANVEISKSNMHSEKDTKSHGFTKIS